MIALFVLKLSAGITLMWWLMPRHDVTDGFFRIQMRVVLGLAVLATLLLTRSGTWELAANVDSQQAHHSKAEIESASSSERTLASIRVWQMRSQVAAAVIAYFGSVFWALGRRLPGNLCIYALVLACCGSLGMHSVFGPASCAWLQLLSDFSSAAVCGSVLTGMLLGHWYLTTPTMSTRPLWWFNAAIFVAAVLRLAASAAAVLTEGIQIAGMAHWIWLMIRWLGTIVVPLIVAAMVWRILRYRNTQSATGVLFAGLILVLMGEMSGALLERNLHIPY